MAKVLNFDSWQRERLFSASMSGPVLKPTPASCPLDARGPLHRSRGWVNKPRTSIWYCCLRKSAAILPVHYILRGNLKMTVNYG